MYWTLNTWTYTNNVAVKVARTDSTSLHTTEWLRKITLSGANPVHEASNPNIAIHSYIGENINPATDSMTLCGLDFKVKYPFLFVSSFPRWRHGMCAAWSCIFNLIWSLLSTDRPFSTGFRYRRYGYKRAGDLFKLIRIHFPPAIVQSVTAKRKERRKAEEKTGKETRKEGEHLDWKSLEGDKLKLTSGEATN